MNGWLLDVNVLLGCGWKSHASHAALFTWLRQSQAWATCPVAESGFVRVSMTTAYQASLADARTVLASLRSMGGHRFVIDDTEAAMLPDFASYKEATDAHLVTLARRHGLKLATLDAALLSRPWAAGIAENPLHARP